MNKPIDLTRGIVPEACLEHVWGMQGWISKKQYPRAEGFNYGQPRLPIEEVLAQLAGRTVFPYDVVAVQTAGVMDGLQKLLVTPRRDKVGLVVPFYDRYVTLLKALDIDIMYGRSMQELIDFGLTRLIVNSPHRNPDGVSLSPQDFQALKAKDRPVMVIVDMAYAMMLEQADFLLPLIDGSMSMPYNINLFLVAGFGKSVALPGNNAGVILSTETVGSSIFKRIADLGALPGGMTAWQILCHWQNTGRLMEVRWRAYDLLNEHLDEVQTTLEQLPGCFNYQGGYFGSLDLSHLTAQQIKALTTQIKLTPMSGFCPPDLAATVKGLYRIPMTAPVADVMEAVEILQPYCQ